MKLTPILALALSLAVPITSLANPGGTKTPVILDTDIGADIDDTWALALLLKCPELDIKLVVGDQHDGIYRAKIIAKMLEVAGRTDIPVGIGHGKRKSKQPQLDWVEEYDLEAYPGVVHDDGVQAIIDTIMASSEPITLLAIGPVPNLEEALRREPRIAAKARFVGMHGSVRKGYGNAAKISLEWNVRANVKACQAVFTAPWEMTITPLDTCGIVHLRGDKYARVRDCNDPIARALVENYRIWWKNNNNFAKEPDRAEQASSTLFDTVAVYLAISQDLCRMETLPIRVTDQGMTVIEEGAKKMQVATEWNDLEAFEDWLIERLTGRRE
jgi:inosine-uridine nucleoside N-ribohydrolase